MMVLLPSSFNFLGVPPFLIDTVSVSAFQKLNCWTAVRISSRHDQGGKDCDLFIPYAKSHSKNKPWHFKTGPAELLK